LRKTNLFKHVLKRQICWRICCKDYQASRRKRNWVWKECNQQASKDKEGQNKPT